jgi:DNA-binding NarL/FixJ family response regulator
MKDLQATTTVTATQRPNAASSPEPLRVEEERGVRIVLADPNEVYRIGVKSLLADLGWATVAGETLDQQGLEELLERVEADMVLMDLSVAPAGSHDIHVIARVRALAPDVAVIVVTDAPHSDIRRAMELGADACLTKTAGREELAAALRLVANGRHYIQAELITPMLTDASGDGLSPAFSVQQLNILQLLSRGLRNKQIAQEFGISVTTVKSHLRLIYSLLAVSSRAEAAAAAVRLGIVS